MANFGFSDLAVVDPYEPVWKETRSAPGAEHLVLKARKFPTIDQATRGFRILLGTSSFHQRRAEQAVVDLPAWRDFLQKLPAGRIAVLFGSERSGLSNQELAACRAVLRIPTDAKTPSMNLAQAVAVTLYELKKTPSPSSGEGRGEAPHPAFRHYDFGGRQRLSGVGHLLPRREKVGDMEPLILSWIDLATAAGYPPAYTPAARAGRIRQAAMGVQTSAQAQQFLLSFSRWLRKKLP